jgi:hypothetical protein
MSAKVWMSSLLDNYDIGMKQGSRTKFYNHEWNPASLQLPISPDEIQEASKRHIQGFALERAGFPEAEAIFDETRFKRIKDIFMVGPFYAVKGQLASVLSRFDLGDGGLVPLTIYRNDLVTPVDGEFFFLNFGARKNTILPEQSQNVVKFAVERATGVQHWKVNSWSVDGDVKLSSAALAGADLWAEETVYNKFFMKEALAQALIDIGMADVLKLQACQVEECRR